MSLSSKVLAQPLPPSVRETYATLAERNKGQTLAIPYTLKQVAFATFLLHIAVLRSPVRIKSIPLLAIRLARRQSTTKAIKSLSKGWPQIFESRHPDLKQRRTRAIDWNRHNNNNMYGKITQWFKVINKECYMLEIVPGNTYSIDKAGDGYCDFYS
ncbi:uncharacterized protein BDR25DRAFT_236812 [Lindgomyces ingoldianus]|uniref:Uncharacterized protein n=1 Tax=Lindgomyces ingoldianus TaxID=673940 RepID=A0ACB6QHQ9_9PLEO|nr:uncharacterized protein BDR25DRAFT_236812 [Lindgomyces ingoldianus]KAF2466528.1 hypothetical protein BDR25DRAFT_236812 [Lindgomyces ingoldianus]